MVCSGLPVTIRSKACTKQPAERDAGPGRRVTERVDPAQHPARHPLDEDGPITGLMKPEPNPLTAKTASTTPDGAGHALGKGR